MREWWYAGNPSSDGASVNLQCQSRRFSRDVSSGSCRKFLRWLCEPVDFTTSFVGTCLSQRDGHIVTSMALIVCIENRDDAHLLWSTIPCAR